MGRLSSTKHSADRPPLGWVLDVLIAVLAVAASLPELLHESAEPPALTIPVLVVVTSPLVLRRLFPMTVFTLVVIAAAATALWSRNFLAGPAVLITLFTVAAMKPRREALIAAAALETSAVLVIVFRAGGGWWYDAIFLSGLVGAALGLGLYAATRRAYLAELNDRAVRLENERDQRGVLAAAAERARIAREMHDIVAHHLTVMVAVSDGAIAATASSPQRGIEAMRIVSATGRRALLDTRQLLGVLREDQPEQAPDELHPVPDLAGLDGLIERVRTAGLATTFEVHGSPPDLSAGVQLTVFRLVQEALTNTLKHGGPTARASVRLRYAPGELRVNVDDDGAGMSTPAGVGAGLSGMRERVRVYGGEVQSGPGRTGGWRVCARLRLDEGDPR